MSSLAEEFNVYADAYGKQELSAKLLAAQFRSAQEFRANNDGDRADLANALFACVLKRICQHHPGPAEETFQPLLDELVRPENIKLLPGDAPKSVASQISRLAELVIQNRRADMQRQTTDESYTAQREKMFAEISDCAMMVVNYTEKLKKGAEEAQALTNIATSQPVAPSKPLALKSSRT